MKKIEVEKTELKEALFKQGGSVDKDLTTKDLVLICLDITPPNGFSPKELLNRSRIQKQVEDSKSTQLELEDADFENLKQIVANSRWHIRHDDILKFVTIFE